MIAERETHTTRNGGTVTFKELASGNFRVEVSTGSRFTYVDEEWARYVANIQFMTLVTGCYACALDKVGRKVLDNAEHTH